MTARIVIDSTTLSIDSAGLATGEIWLDLDGFEFPAKHWKDFIVVLATWWAENLFELLAKGEAARTVRFMDGPYAAKLSIDSRGGLRIGVEETSSRVGRELTFGNADAAKFAQQIISQGRGLVDACRHQNWWSSDADALLRSLSTLQSHIERSTGSRLPPH